MTVEHSTPSRPVNLLLTTSGLNLGGAETVVRDLALALDPGRFKVSICCLKTLGVVGEELVKQGVDIFSLAGDHEGTADYGSFLKLRKVVKDRRIDIVHSHTTHALLVGALCRCTAPGARFVHTFHFGNYPHVGAKVKLMEGLSARALDQLVAVGQVQRQQVKAVYHLRDRAIRTVWNGVQITPSAGDPAFRDRVARPDQVLVGTIATLIEQKGLPDLLAVARKVRDAGDHVRFVIVGEGRLRPQLERLRSDLGLEDTVTFTGWMKSAASVALPRFDIYFQPSLWEAMSIAILEAMAAGKPVVATRVGETPHVITDGGEGLLVEARDIDGMAAAISRLAADPQLRRQLGDAGARKAHHDFTVAHMARAYEAVYTDLLSVPGAHR